MTIRILAVGDVTGESGINFLSKKLRPIKKFKKIDFTVVNGENASLRGITPRQADDILSSGADVITLGNHSFDRQNILPYLDNNSYILRPANASPLAPGRGWGVFETPFGNVCVINLQGRCDMPFGADSPFFAADDILHACRDTKIILVDFHASATSEKGAMAFYLDGRVSVVWGTHTHVQTSDACVLPGGTGFITDLGMSGPILSILGIRPEQSVGNFLGDPERHPYEIAPGDCKIEGAIFEVDTVTGRCVGVESIRIGNEFLTQ